MAAPRRYNIHVLVAKDGDQYSALCYEYTTAGCGPDARSALEDAIHATIEYLEYLTEEGRAHEAPRPAPPELILEYLDLPSEAGIALDDVKQALGKVILASAVLERKLQVEYDVEQRRIFHDFPPWPLPQLQEPLTNYPVELVLGG